MSCILDRFDVSNGLRLGRYRVLVVRPEGRMRKPVTSTLIALTRGDTFVTQVDLAVAPSR